MGLDSIAGLDMYLFVFRVFQHVLQSYFGVRYVKNGDWKTCLAQAEKQGGQVLIKYVALFAANRLQQGIVSERTIRNE